MLERAVKEGVQPEHVFAFEIEGVYRLPNTNKGQFMEQLLKDGKPVKITHSQYWAAMFQEVLEIARSML